MNQNDKTLQSYEERFQEYVDGTVQTVSGSVKAWIDTALALIPKGSTVFEIGSAFGRDAGYIEEQGYKVDRTDAAQKFVEYLRQQGHQARLLNAITDDFGGKHVMVFANAVLLHFTPEQTKQVLDRVYDSLELNGIFAFSVKKGEGEAWSHDKLGAPRYFYYWHTQSLREVIEAAGFEVVDFSEVHIGHDNHSWLHVIARMAST